MSDEIVPEPLTVHCQLSCAQCGCHSSEECDQPSCEECHCGCTNGES